MVIHCSELKSYLERSGQFTNAAAIMGTRLSEPTRSRSTRRKISCGINRGLMTCVAPTRVTVCAAPHPLA